jgi:hypothetical protein
MKLVQLNLSRLLLRLHQHLLQNQPHKLRQQVSFAAELNQ